jgi:transposase-like protein
LADTKAAKTPQRASPLAKYPLAGLEASKTPAPASQLPVIEAAKAHLSDSVPESTNATTSKLPASSLTDTTATKTAAPKHPLADTKTSAPASSLAATKPKIVATKTPKPKTPGEGRNASIPSRQAKFQEARSSGFLETPIPLPVAVAVEANETKVKATPESTTSMKTGAALFSPKQRLEVIIEAQRDMENIKVIARKHGIYATTIRKWINNREKITQQVESPHSRTTISKLDEVRASGFLDTPIPAPLATSSPVPGTYKKTRGWALNPQQKLEIVKEALQEYGLVRETARKYDIHHSTLHRWIDTREEILEEAKTSTAAAHHPGAPFFADVKPNPIGGDVYSQEERDQIGKEALTSLYPMSVTAEKYHVGRTTVTRWARELGKEITPLAANRLKMRNERALNGEPKAKRHKSGDKELYDDDDEQKRKSGRLSGTPLEFKILKKGKGKKCEFWDEKYGGAAVLEEISCTPRRRRGANKDDGESESNESVEEVSGHSEMEQNVMSLYESVNDKNPEEGDEEMPDAESGQVVEEMDEDTVESQNDATPGLTVESQDVEMVELPNNEASGNDTLTNELELSSQTVETTDTGLDDVLMSTQLEELITDTVDDEPAETTQPPRITAFDIFKRDQENAGIEDEVEIQLLWEEADADTKEVELI